MCCHLRSGLLVGEGTSQSLVTRIWMPVLRNLKVISNFNCICLFFLENITEPFLIIIFCSAVIILVDFKMYIVSYNSVQNGLVYFYMSVCNVMMYTKTRL